MTVTDGPPDWNQREMESTHNPFWSTGTVPWVSAEKQIVDIPLGLIWFIGSAAARVCNGAIVESKAIEVQKQNTTKLRHLYVIKFS